MNTERLHLLIVEDEEAHVEVIRRVFARTGAPTDIRVVGTLREYREQIAAYTPDLVLLDLNLPDGRATEVLMHPPEAAPFPVLVMTAFGSQQIVVEVMKAGALDYVVKSAETFASLPHIVEKAFRQWQLLQGSKRAAEALQASEARYRSLFENMLNGFAYCRMLHEQDRPPDLVYLAVNGAFETLTGLKDAVGKKLSEVIPGVQETDPGLLESYGRVARTGVSERFEVYLVALQMWLDIAVYCPAPEHVAMVFDVITERKRAEENLRMVNTQLAQAVVRAEEWAGRAETANRAKSEFLANMSHELRTPLTAILGYSELLNSGEFPPTEQCGFLQTIQRSGEGLLGIINDILDLARIEADRLPLSKTDCPLQLIVNEALGLARIAADKKGLSLQVTYSLPVPATICTDAARLRQILMNLVGNAVKFTERGEVRLTVCCCETGEGTARMQFVVSDTGIGIPSTMREEIFLPFVQVDGSHTRRYGGTGLGLSICQRLAQALDGHIEVASELGRGSTFTLTLDGGPWRKTPDWGASPDQATGPTPRTEPAGAASGEPSSVLQGRVLLVEDEPSLQVFIGHLLCRLKLEVELAGDGSLACQMAEQSRSEGRPYALILMDLQLPELDGLTATRWLRTQGWPGPIVALTAHAMMGDRERCLAAGCDDYLSKPITSSGLREVLRRYLGQDVNA